jgi:hypothetical protein
MADKKGEELPAYGSHLRDPHASPFDKLRRLCMRK